MNKYFMILGTASVLFMASCANGAKTESDNATEATEATETTEITEATETPEVTEATETESVEVVNPVQDNLTAGQAYLDNLKANDKNVKFTPSGLGYRVIKEGKGVKPSITSIANVKYTGRHIDGSVFDSSGDKVIPFPLQRVVPGFTEGIMLMSPGAVYELYLPAPLAYGEMGTPGGPIGPNETLIFEVELVDFQTPGE